MLSRSQLEDILARFAELTIGLVGDLFLDRYLEIAAGIEELSVETGLEAYQVPSVRNSPGALGTVMNNLAALEIKQLVPVTVIGDDGHGYDLLREVRKLPVDDRFVIQDATRLTPTYTKPLRPEAGGAWRELNRLDVRSREPMAEAANRRLGEHIRQLFASCDGVIVLDQIYEADWGVVNRHTRQVLRDLLDETPDKLLFIDSRAHLGQFDFGVLKGNRGELLAAAGDGDGQPQVERAASQLAARTGRCVFGTLGEAGVLVAHPDGHCECSPGLTVSGPLDIVGAGDAATSGIVSSLLSGADPLAAADVGNLVASITVQQLGATGTASRRQVLARHGEVA